MSQKNFATTKVRFAPSPTGFLHIGGARTALFNKLFAKKNDGKFLLRIEDTDQKRSTQDAIDAILQGLDWLDLNPDEAPIFQSKNIKNHQKIVDQLLQNGNAYKCYVSGEELQNLRQKAQEKGEIFRFQSPWRDKNPAQNPTTKPTIRLKSKQQGETVINDLVQGKISVKNQEIDDLVLMRSDGTPTYMLAVVVDDYEMEISHIIRGDDHLTNSFRQKAIYDALDWNCPEFAHIPLIHGSDGAKMSKRHGATSVIDYKKMGYLPQAMRNYLLRLGFSDGDKEIINDDEAASIFDLKKVTKSPARFDFEKLNHLNKYYIKEKTNEELFAAIEEFLPQNPNENDKIRITNALNFLREKPNTLLEIAAATFCYFEDSKPQEAPEIQNEKLEIIAKIKQSLTKIQNWNHDEIKNAIMNFTKENDLKIKDFGKELRAKLTFSTKSAGGIFDVAEVLGRDLVLSRL